ncbi:hypothetical protein [Actinacidiphila sp. ITFR-21]|uniref:hypothetical protein n=1 Tax=Actinacidiphila sp. ITFR-21 TaxID=3075199 RepID=UPI002889C16A|nr:hypothetical protein [Streptomyces sp. ITFR-21]WNI20320.1 hypothetical protein RLT57_33165 [Streptomyces sp. ITFR-21]
MIRTAISGALAGLLGRRRPQGYPTAGFRAGPLWTWCPAERAQTPHLPDAGGLRCLSCKTPTPPHEVKTRG